MAKPQPPLISSSGDVLVRVDLFPINPADILTLQGYYPRSNPDSVTLGIEATGLVENVGSGVVGIEPGNRVVRLGLENWNECIVTDQSDLALAPQSLAPERAACRKVNPATVALLLRDIESLHASDWVGDAPQSVRKALVWLEPGRPTELADPPARETLRIRGLSQPE